jgi:catechol 2,3-dioxygenase-like lactoylglutathione lyase family enzyme
MSLAFANSSDLQIELIAPLDDVPSAASEFLQAGRSGMHHIAYWTERFDETVARALEAGWSIIQTSGGRSAYFEFPDGQQPLVELMELNDRTRWLTDSVRDAARGWNGITDSVRSLPKRPGW